MENLLPFQCSAPHHSFQPLKLLLNYFAYMKCNLRNLNKQRVCHENMQKRKKIKKKNGEEKETTE